MFNREHCFDIQVMDLGIRWRHNLTDANLDMNSSMSEIRCAGVLSPAGA